jgi:hypothetical protein
MWGIPLVPAVTLYLVVQCFEVTRLKIAAVMKFTHSGEKDIAEVALYPDSQHHFTIGVILSRHTLLLQR